MRPPEPDIQPFVTDYESFDTYEMLRYRCGTRYHWLVRYNYYEAQYRRPDGSEVVGPAVGPQPYTAANFFTHVPLALAGVLLFAASFITRPGCCWGALEPQVLGMVGDA
ncbi:MAG: hypothetical protein JSW27_08175 [Phycisphaerales bacterium]|nr:MAG: hypothetical protein JSW27_08175 [Phycisphaerales bacterium]